MGVDTSNQIVEPAPTEARVPWFTPVILSYDAAEVTRAANIHAGDFINSLDS